MQNNNHLSLINFKVKSYLSETFLKINTMLNVQIFSLHPYIYIYIYIDGILD